MLILNGKNLGERQRDLNLKVLEAAVKKIDLNTLRSEDNISDADKLFQIDLASRYKNIDFILNMFKSGDSLCITRALKCSWLYDDNYSDIINTDFLHQNIFPFMSLRMKKKTLTVISLHVRHEERVVKFYSYCVSSKFKKLALKFLVYTPEWFKMDLIKSDDDFNCFDDPKSLKHFLGNSFALALAYIEMHSCKERIKVIYELRFLYTEFKYDYMDVLERYAQIDNGTPNSIKRLGIRISTDILKTNKRRIWEYPLLYINLLNRNMLIKYLTNEDVKSLGALLLPDSAKSFWTIDFYHSYKYILDLIPPTERFAYLKEIFTSKYENESFEFNIQFYNLNYYQLLTNAEQESWALLHIEREEELFGSDSDYIWYKFVGFNVAFEEIKKYVFVNPDDSKRANIINILVYSAKNQEDLIKLLNYYYERHVNEGEEYKKSFLDLIISEHDVYVFTVNCWKPFNKLLYSLEIYDTYCTDWTHNKYVLISMIYHILNEKEFTEDLKHYIEDVRVFYDFNDIIDSLSTHRKSLVVKFWMYFHVEKLKILLQLPHDDKIKEDIVDRICLIWSLIWTFNRDQSECPEIVMTYMKSNMEIYENHPAFKKKFEAMSEEDFVRLLKSDSQKVIESVSKVKCNAHRWSFKLNRLLRKLKVYFSQDVSEIYLKYFMDSFETLRESPSHRIYRNIKMTVVGVLQLGNEGEKEKMLEKYVPVSRKIDHYEIDRYLYQVQKAICRLVYQSRPPVQLPIILKYLKGDYVRFCLPLFYHYFANLPTPRALEFFHETINSPISVQKHGLRLAFKYFSSQDLAHVILQIWKKTKNKSLRMLLYKTLFYRMLDEDGDSQKALYEVLKFYSSDLDHQDHDDVFDLLVSDDIPEYFTGDLIETAWQTLSKFSNKNTNLVRKTSIINHMRKNIYSVNRQFIRDNIIDDHVHTVLYENRPTTYSSQELEDFMKAKWDLTATYVASGNTTLKILENSKELADDILTKFMEMWNHQYRGAYTYRTLCHNFLSTLHYESCENHERYVNLIIIYRRILEILQDNLTDDALYLRKWRYKLSIKSRRVIYKHHVEHNDCTDYKYPCVMEVAIAYAKKVGKFVQGLVESDKFYHSLYADMANALKHTCETTGKIIGISPNGFKILFSGFLTEYKLKETHALAVMVMPETPPKDWEKRHENALDMIRQYDNKEIRCKLYQKFAPSYDNKIV